MGMNNASAVPWSRMCAFRARGRSTAEAPSAALFTARLWANTAVDDRVQHIRVCQGPARLDIGIVLMAIDVENARAAGARICTAALVAHPDTHGWTLQPLTGSLDLHYLLTQDFPYLSCHHI